MPCECPQSDHARARDASILAEVVGYGMSADAYHITSMAPRGDGCLRAMRNALRSAKLEPNQVGHVNAHATSTPAGDVAETMAIKTVFKARASTLPVSATKSMTGHMLGAAGAVESIFTLLALGHGVLPPTINYQYPDPECDLDYVPNTARQVYIRTAMCNSFGFGGTNATLLFRSFS